MLLVGEPRREHILKKKLAKLTGYDYILLDCPPSLGLINQNAMLYASEAIIPTSTDLLGVDGLRKMVCALQKMNEVFDHDIVVSKVVPTLFDKRSNVCKNTLSVIQNEFYTIVSDPIRVNAKLKEIPSKKKPIFKYARSSNGAKDYEKLIKSVLRDERKYDRVAKLATAAKSKANNIA